MQENQNFENISQHVYLSLQISNLNIYCRRVILTIMLWWHLKEHEQEHHFSFIMEGDLSFQDMNPLQQKLSKVRSWPPFCRGHIIAAYWWDNVKRRLCLKCKNRGETFLHTHSKRMSKCIRCISCFYLCKNTSSLIQFRIFLRIKCSLFDIYKLGVWLR